ncbi:MAG: hypothetical protein J6A38_04310 [Clostridia bacterium]|nr:hypothetical protein [Clostridia bacterium]
MAVSKTDFVRGLQCAKMLWLDAHAPELKIIPPEVQARLDAGNEFGDKAMSLFGEYLETTTFREDGRLDFKAMLEKTQDWITAGENVVCEAAFSWYGNYCAADILKKDGDGYALYEVKNTYFVRQEFITDLGFQRLILRKCGVKLTAVKLVLRGDEPPEGVAIPEEENVDAEYLEKDGFRYKIVDVTAETKQAERVADRRVFELGKLKKKETPIPDVAIGEQCLKPYACWYYEHCHKNNTF